MKVYIVKFTQVSHHRVGAVVTATSEEEAIKKAREGDCTDEYDLTHPESYELKDFRATESTPHEANQWMEEQKQRQED